MSFESHFVLSVNVTSLVQNHCKKFKIKIFVKEREDQENHDDNNKEHNEMSKRN